MALEKEGSEDRAGGLQPKPIVQQDRTSTPPKENRGTPPPLGLPGQPSLTTLPALASTSSIGVDCTAHRPDGDGHHVSSIKMIVDWVQ